MQLTFADQNLGLITNKKFNKEYSTLVNKNAGFNEKKKFLKNAINKIGPDTAQQFGKKTYGTEGTNIKSMFKKIGMSPNVLEVKDLTEIEGVTTADKAPVPEKTKTMDMFKNAFKKMGNIKKGIIPAGAAYLATSGMGSEAEAAITYNPTIGAIVKTGSDDVASQSNLLDWAATNPEPLIAAGVGGAALNKTGNKLLMGLLNKLAPIGAVGTAMTVKENMDQGESLPEALADPMAGLGMMGIGAGKLLRMGTPVGAAMTAAGLGKDYYEFAQDEIEKMDAMSDYDRGIYNDMLMDDTNIDF